MKNKRAFVRFLSEDLLSRFWILHLTLLVLSTSFALAAPNAITGPIQTFDYRGVTLDGGRMAEQYDLVKNEYLNISNDNLLKSFRQRAGLPAPGSNMGGWYDSGTFNIFGQVLSGLARFYAGSGDPACKAKADYLIQEWAKCINANGFFFNTAQGNTRHYVYEKMVGGLVDNYLYCGNLQARDCLSRISDWAIKNLSQTHRDGNSEWYTLGENLYRAYLATGDTKYLNYAKVWEYTSYWDRFADSVPGPDLFTNPPMENGQRISFHAYSHVNTFSSAAAAFEVTGDDRYRRIATNAYDYLQKYQNYATGGYGPMEQLMNRSGVVGMLDAFYLYKHFETQCGSWAAFKLAKYLIRFTGEARYGDWVERLVYNGIGASIPAANGRVQYESDYHLGGAWKKNVDDPWTCCAGTRSEAVADYVDQVYFHDAENVYVNLFAPSTLNWYRDGTTITLRQITRFPEEGLTTLTVSLTRQTTFTLAIRSPQWLASPVFVRVNGFGMSIPPDAKGWVNIRRLWKTGDQVRVTLPMRLEWDAMDPQKPYPAAVRIGPTLLAIGSPNTSPARYIDPADLSASLLPIAGEPLHYRLAFAPTFIARPFYEFTESERYFIYLDPKYTNKISLHDFVFHGNWTWWAASNTVGDWAECKFVATAAEGSTVRYNYTLYDDAGIIGLWFDGVKKAELDLFSATRSIPANYLIENISAGTHTLRIQILNKKNSDSSGNYVNVANMDLYPVQFTGVKKWSVWE